MSSNADHTNAHSAPTTPSPSVGEPVHQPHVQAVGHNTMAVLGLIFAFIAPLLGLIFSIIGLKQTKNNAQSGRGLAVAGVALSSLFMFLTIVIFSIFVIAGFLAANADIKDSTSGIVANSFSKKVVSPSVNTPTSIDPFELTVTSLQRGYTQSDSFYTPSQGNEYVVVNLSLKNIGTQSESYSSYDFKIRGANGTEVIESYISDLPNYLDYGSLAVGGKVTGSIAFEVPINEPLTLIFDPSYLSDSVAEVKL